MTARVIKAMGETDTVPHGAETPLEPSRLSTSFWNDRTRLIVLVALAFLIYGFGIGRGFQFDDNVYIAKNHLLGQPGAFLSELR